MVDLDKIVIITAVQGFCHVVETQDSVPSVLQDFMGITASVNVQPVLLTKKTTHANQVAKDVTLHWQVRNIMIYGSISIRINLNT